MREITTHKVGCLNQQLQILLQGEEYSIVDLSRTSPIERLVIRFHSGPTGVNGVSMEALIAIVIDKLQGHQMGAFACRENACAITKFEEGLMWLQQRTRKRIEAQTEGTIVP